MFEFENPRRPPKKFCAETSPKTMDVITAYRNLVETSRDIAEVVTSFLRCCDENYVVNTSVHDIAHHFLMAQQSMEKGIVVSVLDSRTPVYLSDDSDDVFAMDSLNDADSKWSHLSVAMKCEHDDDDYVFHRIVHYLSRISVDIVKATVRFIR